MPDLSLESVAEGLVAGIDEAGRGPWAGPVLAAAVILDRRVVPAGLNDSKKLAKPARERLYEELEATAEIGVGVADVAEIDRYNILGATLLAMRRAALGLPRPPTLALVDGNRLPALSCRALAVVGGDGRSASIAAASIVAKVVRDRLMADLAARFPGYGWERNAGYGTPEHRAALARLGASPEHRRSFAPIRALAATDNLLTD